MLRHQDLSQRSSNYTRAGFTLVEVLVALALLTTALVPAFVLASNAVSLSTSIRNTLTGTNLAQEGVEVVRAIRDSNWFATPPLDFDDGLTSCTSGCTVQYDSDAPVVGTFATTPLKLDPLTGLYQYGSGTNTLFTRTITITDVSAVELKVVSTVTWREKTIDKTITVEYHLFDWIQ